MLRGILSGTFLFFSPHSNPYRPKMPQQRRVNSATGGPVAA